MVVTERYEFKDGRVGTKKYSDRIYKTIEVDKVDEKGNVVLNEQGQPVKEMKNVYYKIKKIGETNPYANYTEAIDILPHEYVELTDEEMAKE